VHNGFGGFKFNSHELSPWHLFFFPSSLLCNERRKEKESLDNCRSQQHRKTAPVAHEQFDRIFADITVSAVDLHAAVGDHHRHVGGAGLGEIGGGVSIFLAVIELPCGFPCQQADGFDL